MAVLHARYELVAGIEVNLKNKGKHLLATDDSKNTVDTSYYPTSPSSYSNENEEDRVDEQRENDQNKKADEKRSWNMRDHC